MLDSRDIGGLQGAPVIGRDNDKLGTVGQVFLDASSGAPNWVTVKSGLFGHKETFIPLANSTWDGEQVHVDIDRDTFKEAPRIDADEALTPHNEEALYRYYGLSDVDTDGGTARPGDYPDREYADNPDGKTMTPVPTDADGTGRRLTSRRPRPAAQRAAPRRRARHLRRCIHRSNTHRQARPPAPIRPGDRWHVRDERADGRSHRSPQGIVSVRPDAHERPGRPFGPKKEYG